jgi:2-oxoglutarate ferredoxin oxidoreductase subunit delta
MAKRKFVIKVDEDLCKGCLLCVEFCPKDCLQVSENLNRKGVQYAVFASGENCTGCKNCATVCPEAAIEIYEEAGGE